MLWIASIIFLFYEAGIGRGMLLMAVLSIVAGRTSNWRRLALAGCLALAMFSAASFFRGDYNATQSPLLDGITAPYINLTLMLNSGCGTHHWYNFIAEFFKKFVPAFLIAKKVYPFNLEMTLCIYPTADDSIDAVSIFTYLGEIFFYKPALLTALFAGSFLGILSREVDRRLVRYRLFTARLFAGCLCVVMFRSRVLDALSFLLSQVVFLLIWPHLWKAHLLARADAFAGHSRSPIDTPEKGEL
jgi:hypothetical protein